jgi:roadblock/LC7 domain-containing protein
MKTTQVFVSLLTISVLCFNCGGKSAEEQAQEAPQNFLEGVEKMAKDMEKTAKDGPKETVDPKKLKELLPADADGLHRKEASSEKTAAMGFGISTANGRYSDDNNASIDVNIIDVAGTGVAMMGMAAWTLASVDKETDDGYEKTTEYDGYKAYEKYNNKNQDGEISVMVANRYIVEVKGSNVSIDKIKATLKDIDLDKLKGL